jgi:hypothetical protein
MSEWVAWRYEGGGMRVSVVLVREYEPVAGEAWPKTLDRKLDRWSGGRWSAPTTAGPGGVVPSGVVKGDEWSGERSGLVRRERAWVSGASIGMVYS